MAVIEIRFDVSHTQCFPLLLCSGPWRVTIVWHTGQDAVIMAKRIGTSTIYMEALGSSDPGGP